MKAQVDVFNQERAQVVIMKTNSETMDRFTALFLTPAAGLAPGERRSRELRAGAVIYNRADYGLRPPSR